MSVLIVLVCSAIGAANLLERLDVEGAEDAIHRSVVHAENSQLARERNGIRRLHRSEASIAATVVRRAESAATGVSDGTEAWRSVRHHHADVSPALAFGAHARGGNLRASADEERTDDLEQLTLVDGTAVQFEVHFDVRGDRSRRFERRDVLGRGVDDGKKVIDVRKVAQCLNASGGGARADRDELARDTAHLSDALRVFRRRHRSFDEGEIVRPFRHRTARLREVRDLDVSRKLEKLVLAVEQRKLTAITRRELPDCESGLPRRGHSSLTDKSGAR